MPGSTPHNWRSQKVSEMSLSNGKWFRFTIMILDSALLGWNKEKWTVIIHWEFNNKKSLARCLADEALNISLAVILRTDRKYYSSIRRSQKAFARENIFYWPRGGKNRWRKIRKKFSSRCIMQSKNCIQHNLYFYTASQLVNQKLLFLPRIALVSLTLYATSSHHRSCTKHS